MSLIGVSVAFVARVQPVLGAWWARLQRLLLYALLVVLLGGSTLQVQDSSWPYRAYIRGLEFDFVSWSFEALAEKVSYTALGAQGYLSQQQKHTLVLEYIDLVNNLARDNALLERIYADPDITDKESATAGLRQQVADRQARLDHLQPLAEDILQAQLSATLQGMTLTLGGQPLPPLLFRTTPLPLALIISPREVIRQDHDLSLLPGIPLDQRIALEERIASALNVSTLITNIGGVGLYPTMVYQTGDLPWLGEVVAHEWVHNFLTLRPLGVSYASTPELRIINETTASIAGKEIGRVWLETYYPELLPPPPPPSPPTPTDQTESAQPEAPVFDFYKEMRITRVTTDDLLAQGKIEEAEAYMEMRRRFLWENGYQIRKLNQAYFAFHGAYADHPSGGAAGADPVGTAVRALRARSLTLADFLERISWITSFEQLQQMVTP